MQSTQIDAQSSRLGNTPAVRVSPAPERDCSSWDSSLRPQADTVLASGFFETVTLGGARLFVLAIIKQATHQIRILAMIAQAPARPAQAAPSTATSLAQDRNTPLRGPASGRTAWARRGARSKS